MKRDSGKSNRFDVPGLVERVENLFTLPEALLRAVHIYRPDRERLTAFVATTLGGSHVACALTAIT